MDGYISARTVTCTKRDRDRYGRVVAVCKVAGVDIGGWLVRHGGALDYARYSGGTNDIPSEPGPLGTTVRVECGIQSAVDGIEELLNAPRVRIFSNKLVQIIKL